MLDYTNMCGSKKKWRYGMCFRDNVVFRGGEETKAFFEKLLNYNVNLIPRQILLPLDPNITKIIMRMCKWSINRRNITTHVLLHVHRIKMNFKRIEVQQSEKKIFYRRFNTFISYWWWISKSNINIL